MGVNQNDVSADLHVWGEPYAATYGFYKGADGVGLIKAWNWLTSWAWFFYESRPVKNTNVTLVLALTRRGSNLEINTRILDKDKATPSYSIAWSSTHLRLIRFSRAVRYGG